MAHAGYARPPAAFFFPPCNCPKRKRPRVPELSRKLPTAAANQI
jgi:hypothetical protein